MAAYNIGIIQAIDVDRMDDFQALYNECVKHDVPVSLWPLLSEAQGYWINANNITVAKRFIGKLLDKYPKCKFVALDFELTKELHGIKKYVAGRQSVLPGYKDFYQSQLDDLVEMVHEKGLKLLNTTYPQMPDFYENLGLLTPTNADFYSCMVYTSYFQSFFGEKLISNLECVACTYYQALIYKEKYGKKAALDLGRISHGVIRSPLFTLHSLEHIRKEISVALKAGVFNLQIFALDDNIFKYEGKYDEFFNGISSCKPEIPRSLAEYLKNPGWIPRTYAHLAKFGDTTTI